MIIRTVVFVFVLLAIGLAFHIFVGSGTSPERVVNNYIQLVVSGDTENTSDMICETPREYNEKRFESIDKSSIPLQSPISNEEMITEPRPLDSLRFSYTLTNGFPQEVKERSLIFERLTDIWTSDSGSRIRVVFRSTINETVIVRKDFFLFKENQSWKIFKVASPSDSERWAQD